MADGSVRGSFDLRTGDAVRGLRSIRDAGREADQSMEALGRRMDALATTSTRVGARVSASWDGMRRSIDDQARRIEERVGRLEGSLDRFGRKRVSATVELNGFDRVNAQISELEMRLDRLGSRTAHARVSLGGGFANSAGGQGMVAGGAGSGLFSSVGGIPGRLPWWAMLAPFAPQLAGAATGLLGSAGSAALGAGAVGIGAMGTVGVGAGLSLAVARPATQQLAQLVKTQEAYNQALDAFGAKSTQAAAAKRRLDLAMLGAPGAGGAARQIALAQDEWRNATAPGRASFYRGVSGAVYNARRALPAFAGAANMATSATAGGITQLSGYLTNAASVSQVRQLTAAYVAEVPTMVSTTGNLVRIFGNLATAAIPFFHEADAWVNRWTTGIRTSTGDTQRMRVEMRRLVDSAKDWGRMIFAAGRTMRDLLTAGRPSGDSMVVQFTHTLDRWDVWLRQNPQKVQSFMQRGEEGFSRIATVVGNLTRDLAQVFGYLNPILTRAEQFLSFASGLGGGSLLTGAGLLYGAYGGARGALGGGGRGAGGALSSFLLSGPGMILGGGGGRMGGGTVVGAEANAVRRATSAEVARGVTGAGTFLMGGATVGTAAVLERRAAAQMAAGESRLVRGLRGLSTRSAALGTVADTLSTGGSVLGGALSGAAKFFAPILGIEAVLSAAHTPGDLWTKLGRGGLGSLIHMGSLGLVGSHAAGGLGQEALGALAGAPFVPFGPVAGAFFSHVAATGASLSNPGTRRSVQAIAAQANSVRTPQQLQALRTVIASVRVRGELTPEDTARLNRILRQAASVAARNAGTAGASSFTSALEMGLNTPGHSPMWAVQTAMSAIPQQLRRLGPQGAKVFAADTAAWVAQMEQDNPQLRRPLDRLMGGITNQLDSLQGAVHGKMRDIRNSVFFFNGQILQGSAATWKQIGLALTDPSQVALEKLTGIWSEINSQAVTALQTMGYSKQQATFIVKNVSKGGNAGAIARNTGALSRGANVVGTVMTSTGANLTLPGAVGMPVGKARGGMIGGAGLMDTVPTPDGGMAAPGEAWIANRHTMRKLDAAALSKFGKTAWQVIRDEDRPHSAPMRALGGPLGTAAARQGAGSWFATAYGPPWGGIEGSGVTATGMDLRGGQQAYVVAVDPSVIPLHSNVKVWPNPFGYQGTFRAEDTGGAIKGQHIDIYDWLGRGSQNAWGVRNVNVQVVGGPSGGASSATPVGGGGGFSPQQIGPLSVPATGLGGVPGALATGAGRTYAAGLRSRINALLGAGVGGGGGGAAVPGGSGVVMDPSGRPVAGWIEPILQWARGHGWGGSVSSGWRSYAEQAAIYASGVRPAAIPGTSNHEQTVYPGGAVDVTDAAALSSVLQGSPYSQTLVWAGSKDPVHFSHPHGGGYSRGGRATWGGWHERGGSWVTQGPTVFGAGEKGKRERVTIEPISGHRRVGGGIIVNMSFTGGFSGSPAEVDRVGREVAAKILEALDRVGQGVSDSELMAGAR